MKYILFFLGLTVCVPAFSQVEKALYHAEYARYDSAAFYYRKAIDAGNAQAQLGWISTQLKLGRFSYVQEGIAQLEQDPAWAASVELGNLKGQLLLQQGRSEDAIAQFEQNLVAHPQNDSLRARILNELGVAYWNAGRNQQALASLEQSLAQCQAYFGEEHPEIAAIYNNLGLVFVNTDTEKALLYYQRALALYEKIYPSQHPSIANAYVNIAVVYNEQQAYVSADYNFRRALDLFVEIYGESHPSVAFVYNNLGRTALADGLFYEASDFHNRALRIYKHIFGGRHPETANTFFLLGNVYAQEQNPKRALYYYQHALRANALNFDREDLAENPAPNDYLNVLTQLNVLLAKGKTLEQLYYSKTLNIRELKSALAAYQLADAMIDKERGVRNSEADKLALGTLSAELYPHAVESALRLAEVTLASDAYQKQAFYFSEKSKALVLLTAISDTKAKAFANIPNELLEEERTIKARLLTYEQELTQATSDVQKNTFRDAIFQETQRYEAFLKNLETQFPQYYALKYKVAVSSVEAIQGTLSPNTAMLSYMRSADRLFIFLITATRYRVWNVPLESSFEEELTLLRNAIFWQVDDVFAQSAHALYKQLIPKKIPSKITQLVIVPEETLGTTPFETLLAKKLRWEGAQVPWEKGVFLLRKYAVSYAYSATLFQEQSHGKKQGEARKENILLLAPIYFGKSSATQLSTLPATRQEITNIGEVFKGRAEQISMLLEEKASEAQLKQLDLTRYDYLHFATHGLVNELHPARSQLFLAANESEDGNLYAGEIYNLTLDAQLVTLSACQTGLGKVTRGEGIVGLSRALLFAGTRNLVVSLWSVADNSTESLMVTFYQKIVQQTTPNYARALRHAKLQMLDTQPAYAAPYYWAPFVLVGK